MSFSSSSTSTTKVATQTLPVLALCSVALVSSYAIGFASANFIFSKKRCLTKMESSETSQNGTGENDSIQINESDYDLKLQEFIGKRNVIKLLDSANGTVADDSSDRCIYLDYNGTTPIYREIFDCMIPYFTKHFGNPSSSHLYGQKPRQAISRAREQILNMLLDNNGVPTNNNDGASCSNNFDSNNTHIPLKSSDYPKSSIIFTGCGTESDNLAIHMAFQYYYQCHTHRDYNESAIPNAEQLRTGLPHVVTSIVEHPAILQCLKRYERTGECTVSYVPVQSDGRVLASDMLDAINSSPNTVLVSLMLANNETGAIQPVKEVSEYCQLLNLRRSHSQDDGSTKNAILVHVDAAQAVGKVSVSLQDMGHPDMITIVGHKIGAPKGIACLYIRPNCFDRTFSANFGRDGDEKTNINESFDGSKNTVASIEGLLLGGGQEFGIRSGTENVPYIVGLGQACENCQKNWKTHNKHMEYMRSMLLEELQLLLSSVIPATNTPSSSTKTSTTSTKAIVHLRVNGPSNPNDRLPNTLSVGLSGTHSGDLLARIGARVAASAGAACHSTNVVGVETNNKGSDGSDVQSISSVLKAMNVPTEFARGTIRFSVGPQTTPFEIKQAAKIVVDAAFDQVGLM